jgi:hypothetical protein
VPFERKLRCRARTHRGSRGVDLTQDGARVGKKCVANNTPRRSRRAPRGPCASPDGEDRRGSMSAPG